MRVAVVIPALDEATTIAAVVQSARRAVDAPVYVVDGGSADATAERARAAGARVCVERRRGYGRACDRGLREAARDGAAAVAFLDGAGAEDPADLPAVLGPVAAGRADLVVGSRVRGWREPGALRPLQRVGNALATRLIAARTGHRYSDLGSMRAIGVAAYDRLELAEMTWGWPTQLQVRAATRGLRIQEVPVRYRRRRGGRSKVSASARGSARAGVAILRVVLWGGS